MVQKHGEKADADMVTKAILESDSLDQSVCDAVSSFPQVFHAAMVEDLRSMDAEEANVAMEKQIEEADNRLWAAKQQSFETLLKRDLQTIERASRGHSHLKDRLLDIVKLVLFSFFSIETCVKLTLFQPHFLHEE